jgi:hypothetical protein
MPPPIAGMVGGRTEAGRPLNLSADPVNARSAIKDVIALDAIEQIIDVARTNEVISRTAVNVVMTKSGCDLGRRSASGRRATR